MLSKGNQWKRKKERKSKRNFKILFTFANIPYIRLDNNENVQFWENISWRHKTTCLASSFRDRKEKEQEIHV